MDPYFANGSCDPFHAKDTPCSLGDFVVYTVNVSVPDHITKTLQFVAEHNIRLVIRNTGHDYLGKSTGTGALGLWMHHLHDINISDYRDAHYNGKAITVGAGVMAFEAYRAADAQGLQVVGGECPTVGIAGGYTQGGGHSLLSSRHGLAADQVLSWEVVLANGELVTATRDNKHADLYWALSGGGGGTYGVVWSMTAKAHPDTPVSGLNLTFSSEGVDKELFYYAASLFHETLPALVDAGVMCVTILTQTTFEISPMAGPDIPVSELLDLLEPFTDDLEDLGIQYAIFANQFPGFLSQHQAMMPPVPVESVQLGSWLVPREVVVSNSEGLTAAWRRIVEDGATVLNVGLNVSKAVAGDVDNAVLPAWRDALVHSAISTTWEWEEDDKMRELERKMTDVYIPEMVRLAPESGAYMNEVRCRLLHGGMPVTDAHDHRRTFDNLTFKKLFTAQIMLGYETSKRSTTQMIFSMHLLLLDQTTGRSRPKDAYVGFNCRQVGYSA